MAVHTKQVLADTNMAKIHSFLTVFGRLSSSRDQGHVQICVSIKGRTNALFQVRIFVVSNERVFVPPEVITKYDSVL